MNRSEFLEELKGRLRKLPYDEIKQAVDYYEEYFDDAGQENEQAALADLGTPAEVASQIIAEFAVKDTSKTWSSTWLVITTLLASPVAVPLAVAAVIVAGSLIFAIAAIVGSFFFTGFALALSGILCMVTSIFVALKSIPTTMLLMGIGLMLGGFGLAIILWSVKLSKICFGWLSKMVGAFILRRKAK